MPEQETETRDESQPESVGNGKDAGVTNASLRSVAAAPPRDAPLARRTVCTFFQGVWEHLKENAV